MLGGVLAELENLAEMLENHELRLEPGGVPFGPGCLSIDPDRESRLAIPPPGEGVVLDGLGSGWPLVLSPLLAASTVPCGFRGFVAADGIARGCAAAGVFGGDEADLLNLSASCVSRESSTCLRLAVFAPTLLSRAAHGVRRRAGRAAPRIGPTCLSGSHASSS